MEAVLKKRGWLKRIVEINDGNKTLLLTYNGRGSGCESASIQGDILVEKSKASLTWFVPEFDLTYKEDKYLVEVKVWPWLALRSIMIKKNGNLIYSEGKVRRL